MVTYKISLLGLFLIMLGALVVSILVGNWFQSKEGMVSYQYGVAPLTNVQIPNYTNETNNYGTHVNLLFDNIYFDTENANLIEINGNGYTTGNVDLTGNTISSISVSSHNDNNNSKQINTFVWNTTDSASLDKLVIESKRLFKPSYYEYDYITTSPNTDKYQVFVIRWNDSTYTHVINLTEKKNVITTCFGPEHTSQSKLYDNSSNDLPFTSQTSISDNSPVLNAYYSEEVNHNLNAFILSGQTLFEEKNKLVILLKNPTGPIFQFYNQDGNSVLPTQLNTQSVSKTKFVPFILYDDIGNKMILTITNGPKTLIAIFEPNGTNYRLFNVKRFNFVDLKAENVYGIDQGPDVGDYHASKFDYNQSLNTPNTNTSNSNTNTSNSNTNTSNSNTNASNSNVLPTTTKNSPDMMNDYYRWFYYWATQGLNKNPNSPNFNYSDDYIMKTQIVPPVCPSCPSCPSIGTCTNCGGQGGSGTQTSSGNSYLKDAGNFVKDKVGNPEDRVKGFIKGTEDNLRDLVTGTRDEVNLAADSTVNIAKNTVSGAVNLGKDIVGGTVGLGREIVGGTVGLGKDIVGGIVNLGEGGMSLGQGQYQNQYQKQYQYQNQYQSGSAANQLLPKNNSAVVDQSNLYGAMPNKGKSNYMPVGSDFSKFGR